MTVPYYVQLDVVAARTVEYPPETDWDTGANRAASNACGIGIGEGADLVGTPDQFTLLDQNGAARTPQLSQSIGGIPAGDGSDQPPNPLVDEIRLGTVAAGGTGGTVYVGNATLNTLATGWEAVV